MSWKRIYLGGLPVDAVTQQAAIATIDDMVDARRGGFVVTPNVDHLVCARTNADMRDAYHRARLSLPDGMPLLWMARALGMPLPEKVSGSDLLGPLMALAASKGRRVFLFGATSQASAAAAHRLTHEYPGLALVGRDSSFWSPGAGPEADEVIVSAIRAAKADIVVVALGSPKQEVFMARFERQLAPAVLVGLGGSLDFAAGTVRRAPAWMSRAGLEWLFRLAQEPGRLAYRYLVRDLAIVPIFAADLVWRAVHGTTAIGLRAARPEES
ncbi:MAG: WecB/TagA/CpsF family glycosyltransferase [Vicinamibacterales bacterium]|nr:WecB/TagA/CpsF family glycosyltransferase [Vicinamibacterales bacterium]